MPTPDLRDELKTQPEPLLAIEKKLSAGASASVSGCSCCCSSPIVFSP